MVLIFLLFNYMYIIKVCLIVICRSNINKEHECPPVYIAVHEVGYGAGVGGQAVLHGVGQHQGLGCDGPVGLGRPQQLVGQQLDVLNVQLLVQTTTCSISGTFTTENATLAFAPGANNHMFN